MSHREFQVASISQFDPGLARFTFPSHREFFARLGAQSECQSGDESPWAVVARSGDRAVGMLLAGVGCHGVSHAHIHSLYVLPPARGQGCARAMLRYAEAALLAQGVRELRINYVRGKASIEALEHLLETQGWETPEMNMLVIKSHIKDAVKAPWFREWKLPSNYQILRWDEVSEAQLDEIRESHKAEHWIAEDLEPFGFLKDHDPETSLALVRDGKVRGWLINHRVEGVLRYTCSFVHPDLQRKGRVFCLYSEAVRKMPALGLEKGMWTVPKHHPAMQAFARRWMQPYCYHFSESMDARKRIV